MSIHPKADTTPLAGNFSNIRSHPELIPDRTSVTSTFRFASDDSIVSSQGHMNDIDDESRLYNANYLGKDSRWSLVFGTDEVQNYPFRS